MDGLETVIDDGRQATQIFDQISVVNDPIRCRILLLVELYELTVTELCTILQLPQSTVSRHLKTLADQAWVAARRDGTSRRYSSQQLGAKTTGQRLWQLLREEIAASPAAVQDRSRLETVLAQRQSKSQEFFSTAAGQWAHLRHEMFGARFDLEGLLGLLDESWTVGDLGCGTGQTAQSLAPFVDRVIAIDDSKAMLDAAWIRLQDLSNVEVRQGRLEALPVQDAALDAAVILLVLHHVADPFAVLTETARSLEAGGRVLLVDMLPHQHEEYRLEMGHVWLGFGVEQLGKWLSDAGFEAIRVTPLPADPAAKGPTLFAASAKKQTKKKRT